MSSRVNSGYASALGFPSDGTHITSYALNYLPASCGTITLTSSDVNKKPVIDLIWS